MRPLFLKNMKYFKLLYLFLLLPLNLLSEPYPIEYWAVRDGVANFNISADGTYVSYQYIGSKRSKPLIHILKTDKLNESPKVIGLIKWK